MREILKKIKGVSNQELNAIDTNNISNYKMYGNTECYHVFSGREHYRLLMYISTLFNNEILFDIGTNECRSAIALSHNKNNTIKSYDIIQINPENPVIENVKFILGDSIKDEDILSTPFIFLDVDHDGTYENIFYTFLKEKKWKGILMLDDIHLNDPMRDFWNKIEEEKYDLTSIGHWSGTGIVVFE
jgi:hypothetical protein